MKKILFSIIMAVAIVFASAQSYKVYYANGTVSTLEYADVDSIVVDYPESELPEWSTIDIAAQYTDPVMSSFYFNDPLPAITTSVQKSNVEEGVYRILDPYAAAYEYGLESCGNPLEFDLSDPRCVLVPLQDTGITDSSYGPIQILSLSDNYNSIDAFLASAYADYIITFSTSGSEVTVNFAPNGIWYYFPEYDTEHIYYCGDAAYPGGLIFNLKGSPLNAPACQRMALPAHKIDLGTAKSMPILKPAK